jgi:hypothetical protein
MGPTGVRLTNQSRKEQNAQREHFIHRPILLAEGRFAVPLIIESKFAKSSNWMQQ